MSISFAKSVWAGRTLLFALLSAWPLLGQISFSRRDLNLIPGALGFPNLVADFNNDGILDIAVLNSDSVAILLGSGDGTFQAGKVTTIVETAPRSLAAGDLNHDGNQDIVTTDGAGNFTNVLLGKGDGTFQAPIVLEYAYADVAIGDMNGDGNPDLVMASYSQGFVFIALGNGDGTFSAPFPYPVRINQSGVENGTIHALIADVNQDGRADVVAVNETRNDISILLGNGDGTLQSPVTYPGPPGALLLSAAVGDVNGDGSPDIVVGIQSEAASLGLFLGNGDGTFQNIRSINGVVAIPNSIALGDVTGDGILDVVTTGQQEAVASVSAGKGDGTFQSAIFIPVGLEPFSVTLADLNGDLNLDIVTGNLGDQDTSVLLNDYPDAVRVSPSSGGGLSQTFAFTFSHPKGPSAIVSAHVDINASTSQAGGCYVLYLRASNSIALADDQGNLRGPLAIGSAGTAQNSQCSIDAGASSIATSGRLLTLNLAIVFQASFAGAKNIYMQVNDVTLAGPWARRGAWTVGSNLVPDFSFSIAPATNQTVVAGAKTTYIVTAASVNGFNGVISFQASVLPVGATGSFSPPSVTGSGSSILTIQTTIGTSLGASAITVTALSSTLNHHANAALNVLVNSGPPAPALFSPSGGLGTGGLFAFTFYNPGGVAGIVSAQVNFNTTTGTAGGCYVKFISAANTISLADDAGTLQTPLTIGTQGTSENSRCVVDGGASSTSSFGNSLSLNLSVQFKAAFGGDKNVYMRVFNGVQDSGWQQMGTWTATGPLQLPTPLTVSPGGGAGLTQIFSFVFQDPNGVFDIASAQMDINAALSPFSGCYLYYVAAPGLIYLANNAGVWQGPMELGSPRTLQNSQCTVDGAHSSAASSGTTLTLNISLAFNTAFAGPKNVYMEVRNASRDSGWSLAGTWNVAGVAPAPVAASVTPNSGNSTFATLDFLFSDSYGATQIESAQIDISATLAVAHACYIYYVRSTNAIYLASDTGAWQGPLTLGSPGKLENGQCSVDAGTSFGSSDGSILTLELALGFKVAFAGSKNIYMEVRDAVHDSGWSLKGTWTVPSVAPIPDFLIGMPTGPATVVAGASPTFTVPVLGFNGFDGSVSFSISGLPSGVTARFNPSTVSGSGSTTLTLSTAGAAPSSFIMVVTGSIGALQRSSIAGLTITAANAGPPVPTSVSPNSGTGLSQTFAFTFTAPNGANDITSAQVDINASLAVANACYLFYVRAPNQLYLASDAGVWQGPITLGGSGILQNSQCSVSASGSSATPSGNTLTLDLALTFKAAFAGSKNVYMEVKNASHDSGWTNEGTWTVGSGGQGAAPPAPVAVTPNTGSGLSHTFAFAFSDPNGATDIVSAQMDINATLAVPNACYLYYVRAANTIYLASDTGVWQGPLTIGSAGTLQNSQCSVNSATSSVSASGNTLTVNLALTFKAAFTGSKNIYMEVRDGTHDSGWSLEGSWIP